MLEFANKLRRDGIDANIDLFEESPKEGWPRWMENQIRLSDYVLVVCNELYEKRFYDVCGKGVTWEIQIIYQLLYDNKCKNEKFIPVFWNKDDAEHILAPLKPYTYYNIGTDGGYKDLWRRLLGIKKHEKAELGDINLSKYDEPKLDSLPEKKQKVMFFTTPINLELWNAAGWKGMVYLLPDPAFAYNQIPMLGFLYRNYEAAAKIFRDFQQTYKDIPADDYMKLVYVIPPLPADCFVNKEPDYNYGKGYFVYLGPNFEEATKRAISIDGGKHSMLITALSRYTWVDELKGSTNRETFEMFIHNNPEFQIIPVGMKDERKGYSEENLILGYEYALTLHGVKFKKGIDMDENDPCKIVLKPTQRSRA